ncbi:MAG: hypothetical protein AAGF53_18685 [Pseudomonadota bacterium]
MRSILALMFFAPIVMGVAVQSGVEYVTPLMVIMSAVALAAHFTFAGRRA